MTKVDVTKTDQTNVISNRFGFVIDEDRDKWKKLRQEHHDDKEARKAAKLENRQARGRSLVRMTQNMQYLASRYRQQMMLQKLNQKQQQSQQSEQNEQNVDHEQDRQFGD